MKKLLPLSTLLMIGLPLVTLAASDSYQMLAPIQQLTGGGNTVDLATYIPNMIKLIIGLASALAVIKIIIGGVQYMSTDAVGGKSSGKETIQNALLGLLLAISAYTILYTVNPKLLNIDLNIDRQAAGQAFDSSIGSGFQDEVPDSQAVPPGLSAGKSWPPDSNVRTNFTTQSKKLITFNHPGSPGCSTIGQKNCTSVAGISSSVVDGLSSLAVDCNCAITITGGTEYWLHGNRSTELTGTNPNKTSHKSGGKVVDISLYTPISVYIRANGTKINSGDNCVKFASGPERYQIGNGLYVNELIAGNDPHWHVCFN